MKATLKYAILTIALAALSFDVASAQDTRNQERDVSRARDRANVGQLDEKTRGTTIRVSQLIGYNIQNSQGESVGEIKDIVLDSRTGKVRYAAVTYGGFLGMGDKLFAVPFEAFRVQVDPDELDDRDDIDSDDYVLVLNVTQEQLEGQQGFDEDNWPNMADRAWARDLDKRYGVNRNEDAKERMLRENRQDRPNRGNRENRANRENRETDNQ
ncbi:PRC-barrel domain-containing protein [Rhodopirellula maiorica SM1]|uniref:PRC-barrel domain-containing protein n=1 Tax=Rhodopirellula maiorica SM1 TaxID=1265738 RepID=M5RPJ6_9BACT|nr:PRC-barrel domain-containing protein [Rhodopirellula maiorica]EMI21220.1 PRC-barrel domain-containing protein [Rhodopirellula maiorica SM1]